MSPDHLNPASEPTALALQRLTPVQHPLVNKFYKRHRVRGRAKRHDQVWIIKSNQHIAAVLRITPGNREPGAPDPAPLLCGVYVLPDHRQHGLASTLIRRAVLQHKETYTFAYRHLQSFYQALAFEPVAPRQLPASLAGRFHRYCLQGRDIVPMRYRL